MACTFEQGGECGMHDNSGTGWVPERATQADHTTHTAQGHVFELRGGGGKLKTKVIKTPKLKSNAAQCLTFFYRSEGKEEATLTVWVESNGHTVSEKNTLVKMAQPTWRASYVNIFEFFGENIKVVFEGKVGDDHETVIQLDDLVLTDGNCPSIQGNCDFTDETTCLWTNEEAGLQWVVSDSQSFHRFNGPASDGEKTHYALFETGPHHPSGSIARLSSPTIVSDGITQEVCFKFSFAASSEHAGKLSVLMVDVGEVSEQVLWELYMTGDYADSTWHEARVLVRSPPKNYLLVMQADSWDGREGYIAVNSFVTDIQFCALTPPDAAPSQIPPSSLPPETTTPEPVLPLAPLKCDFEDAEKPLCDFLQDSGEYDGLWNRVDASSPPSPLHPGVDHTLHTGAGHYIAAAMQQDSPYNQSTARLKTPRMDNNLEYCLTFFLHHIGDRPPPLIVNVEVLINLPWDGPQQVEVLRRESSLHDTWVFVERDIQANIIETNIRISIEAKLSTYQDGDASLDDLRVSVGRCPDHDSMSCSFQQGLCGYEQEQELDDLDWLWHDGKGDDDVFLPLETHWHFYYAYLNTSAPPGSTGVMYTTELRLASPHCMVFNAHIHAEKGKSAVLEVLNVGEGTIADGQLLGRFEDLGPDWATLQVVLPPSERPMRLAFQGIIPNNENFEHSTLAVDDIFIRAGGCDPPGYCTFDGYLCTWFNNENMGSLVWESSGPGDLSLETRPYADSTQRDHSGGFMFIEADEALSGKRAWLMSDRLAASGPHERCLIFWYHMYGAKGTSLSAHTYWEEFGQVTTLWGLKPSEARWDSGWQYAAAPFSNYVPIQLVFEAVLGSGFMGDVAIDDVLVASGGCALQPAEATSGVNYTTPVLPTLVPPSTVSPDLMYDCSFDENDLCAWTSDDSEGTGNQMVWQVASDPYSGGYAFLDIAGEDLGRGARGTLISPAISGTAGSCLSFSYILDGLHELNVLILKETFLEEVWHVVGPIGTVWEDAQVTIASNYVYQIIFEGVRASSPEGTIAIDNITLSFEACKKKDEFCDFEGGHTCGWHPATSLDSETPRWELADGQYSHGDHTTGVPEGHVLKATNTWSSYQNTALSNSSLYVSLGISCPPENIFGMPVGELDAWLFVRVPVSYNLFRLQLVPPLPPRTTLLPWLSTTSESSKEPVDYQITTKLKQNGIANRRHIFPFPGECNFNNGDLCGWIPSRTEKAYWEVIGGSDHTYGDLGGGMLALKAENHVPGTLP
ncbi:MAM and LDL-receptor class A domain-containing protein 2-like [Penaeus monodon]|uniref:MAM and LDL-receptor class A domain-containing protein 2-like n=1 Tax=Penaeus monodon TaxID=6687 RepID=UPI0018A724EB|nr:MAM and LDL-receptor class A domain-containing protein 2-like [Penaeus monodon]